MKSYFFYQGNNSKYVNVMRDKLGLLPSFKGKTKVVEKIDLISRDLRDFCRNIGSTYLLTSEIKRDGGVTFYIEDNTQTILGAIVFHLDKYGHDITISALCTPVSTGIGTKLLNYVIEFGKLTGYSTIRLRSEYQAVSFYRTKGFKMIEEEEIQLYDDVTELNPLPSAADRRISNQQSASDFSQGVPNHSAQSNLILPRHKDETDLYFTMIFDYATDYVSKKTRVKKPKQRGRSVSQYIKKIKSNTQTRKYRSI
jgi:hypothetical protein